MLTRNNPVEFFGDVHYTGNNRMGLLQHAIVIRIYRQIGVHIAVASMHVKGYEHPGTQHPRMTDLKSFHEIAKGQTRKESTELVA